MSDTAKKIMREETAKFDRDALARNPINGDCAKAFAVDLIPAAIEDYEIRISSVFPEKQNPVLDAIDDGGGQTCDIRGVLIALRDAGFQITRKD